MGGSEDKGDYDSVTLLLLGLVQLFPLEWCDPEETQRLLQLIACSALNYLRDIV